MTLEPLHFTEDGEAKVRCLVCFLLMLVLSGKSNKRYFQQATITTLFWQDEDERIVGSSKKVPDLRSINAAPSPVFQDDREASLLGELTTLVFYVADTFQ